jgi:hypothetical protein
MNTQIKDLEQKIEELHLRSDKLTELFSIDSSEINSFKTDLADVVKQLELIKKNFESKDDDLKLTIEDANHLASIIDTFIKNHCFDACYLTSNDADDVELSVNYDLEIELESATINVEDYFINNFSFDRDSLLTFVQHYSGGIFSELSKYITERLFNIISDAVDVEVRAVDTSVRFSRFDDFEVELSYSKKLEVTEVRVQGDELEEHFYNEFNLDESDIQSLIYTQFNLSDEDETEDSDEEENSEN